MKIFLDTINIESIKKAKEYGLLSGVTTNPLILSQLILDKKINNKSDLIKIIKEAADLIYPKPINIEVTKRSPKEIYTQAKDIANLAKNVVVKIPCHKDYIEVIKELLKDKVKINTTLLFSLNQAFIMCKLKVDYISPFIARLDDIGSDGLEVIKDIKDMIIDSNFKTQVIAASIRSIKEIEELIKNNIDIATIPVNLFDKLLEHPLTDSGIALFDKAWKNFNIDF